MPIGSLACRPLRCPQSCLPEVLARTGLSRSTVYVRLTQGRFPRPVSLGARAVGWIESEVDEWMRARIAASRSDAE